jgi:peptide/nickel transport system ATP-binding protein
MEHPDELVADRLRVELDVETGVVTALAGVSLSMRRGETFALVGESGCGKSMTALALLRLLPDNGLIVEGRVALEGEDLLALPESRMRERRGGRIGIIFQDPSTSLNPVMRIGDQIAETIRTHTGLRGAAVRAKALDWLRRVGIPEPERRLEEYPFQLSGGQKQRVMIAIALSAEPEVLIADEPTTALDVTIQAQILDLLKDLQAELKMAILLITHDLAVVAHMAHRVALMYAGQIVETAAADEFFARPLHPYAVQLFAALPDAGKRKERLASIRGTVPALTGEFAGCRFADRCDRVMEVCRSVRPELADTVAGHAVRCLLYVPEIARRHAAAAEDGVPPVVAPPLHEVPVSGPAAAAGAPVLAVEDLSVHFPIRKGLLRRTVGYVKAVDGVSFTVQAGKTLALVGESGCGKTTTGKALVQLLRESAHIRGEVRLGGLPLMHLTGEALRAARRRIQIIFQDPFASLNPRMRVGAVLEEGLLSLRPEWDAAERAARVRAIVERVGLRPDALERYPHEFSGGQRQRIAIARALAVEPEVVVCDEPTSALDVSVQAQILNLLHDLQSELGVAYLFITHNFGVVEYLADEVAVMVAGKMVEQGRAEQVLHAPQHPYTQRLLAAVPRLQRAA